MSREIAWGRAYAAPRCWGYLLIYRPGAGDLRNGMSQERIGKWGRLRLILGLKQGKEKVGKATKEGDQSGSEPAVSWK